MNLVSFSYGSNLPGALRQRHSLHLGLSFIGLWVLFADEILQLALGVVELYCVVPDALIALQDGLQVVLLGLGDRLLGQALPE